MITIHVIWRTTKLQKFNLFIYIQQEVNNDLLDFRHDFFLDVCDKYRTDVLFFIHHRPRGFVCCLSIDGESAFTIYTYKSVYGYIYMVWRLRQKPHHHRTYFQTLSACEMGQYLRDQSTSVLYRRNEWVSKWWESTEISSHTTHIVYSIFSRVLSRYSSDIYHDDLGCVCAYIYLFVKRNGNSPCQVENTQDVLYICCTFVRSTQVDDDSKFVLVICVWHICIGKLSRVIWFGEPQIFSK